MKNLLTEDLSPGGMSATVPAGVSAERQAFLDGAFVMPTTDDKVKEYLSHLQAGVDAARMDCGEEEMTEEHRKLLQEKTLYLIPARNEEKRIASVVNYLVHDHRIPLHRILVMSASTDGTDALVKSMGVPVHRQEEVFGALLNTDKFLEMQRADSMKKIAGKGMTLLAGLLSYMDSGVLHKDNADDEHVVMLDSDPKYGEINGYDPLSSFAKMRMKGAQTLKPAKNGPSRNNSPIYIATNAIGVMSPYARSVSGYLGRQQWLLSGEMSRPANVAQNLVLSTGYPVETTMNISDHDLGLKIGHYPDHRRRGDVDNHFAKDQVMYDFILRTMYAIVLKEMQTRKRLTECGISELADINDMIAGHDEHGMPWPMHVRDEYNEVPDSVSVQLAEYPRVIGSIRELARNNIVRVKSW